MSLYSLTCEGDAVTSGHPIDCLKYSYTGIYNTTVTYYSYTGDYMTSTYGGPICSNTSNNPECINQTNWCIGEKDPRLKSNLCSLFKKIDVLIGDVVKSSKFDNIKNGSSYIDIKTFYGPYLGFAGPFFGYIDGN